MNLDLTDEQSLLKSGAEKFLAEHCGFAERQAMVAADAAGRIDNWRAFAELGWLALGVDEAFGGYRDADTELMLLAEALGRALAPEPFYSTVVLGAGLIQDVGSEPQKRRFLPRIVAGEMRLAFAGAEPGTRHDLDAVETRATDNESGFEISGAKSLVVDGPMADYLIVSARGAAGVGVGLFLVAREAAGIARRDYRMTDGRRASEVVFEKVQVSHDDMLGSFGEVESALNAAFDRVVALACADAVGAMDFLLNATLEHVRTRRQFGTPIGKFQALQHRLADFYVNLELARSMALYANLSLRKPAEERSKAVSQAKLQTVEAARFIGRQAIQLHGGMGMTNESPVGHYFKRLLAFESLFGDINYHAARLEAAETS